MTLFQFCEYRRRKRCNNCPARGSAATSSACTLRSLTRAPRQPMLAFSTRGHRRSEASRRGRRISVCSCSETSETAQVIHGEIHCLSVSPAAAYLGGHGAIACVTLRAFQVITAPSTQVSRFRAVNLQTAAINYRQVVDYSVDPPLAATEQYFAATVMMGWQGP